MDERQEWHPDPRAVRVAQGAFAGGEAENVVLCGSRARGDWDGRSDLDLLIVECPPPAHDSVRRRAEHWAAQEFGLDRPRIDAIFITRRQYQIQARHSRNGIAAISRREGVSMAYPPPDLPEGIDPDPELTERGEMARRLEDANLHYILMHVLLDNGMENRGEVSHAHRALERALKALISAQGREYPYKHGLHNLHRMAQVPAKLLQSDLAQLNQYAGGAVYFAPQNPVTDYKKMANALTADLSWIYGQVTALTGTDAWSCQPQGVPRPAQPVYR